MPRPTKSAPPEPEMEAAPAPPTLKKPKAPAPKPAPKPPPPAPKPPPPAPKRKGAKPPMKPSLVLPKGDEALVTNLMSRTVADPNIEFEPPDPVVKLAEDFITRTVEGKPLGKVKAALEAMLKFQTEKGEIMQGLINEAYMNGVPTMIQIVNNTQRVFKAFNRYKDITVADAIAMYKIGTAQLELVRSGVLKPGIKPVDKEQVGKTDVAKQAENAELMLKYGNTTPQGREIIRKKLYKLKKDLKAAGMVPTQAGISPSP